MADNVTIPAQGTGSTTPLIATDDAGAGGHVQIMKLAIDTDGSRTLIPAIATRGLKVDSYQAYVEGDDATTPQGFISMYRENSGNTAVGVSENSPLPVRADALLAALALDSTLTGGNQKTQIVDSGANVIGSGGTGSSLNAYVTNFPASQAIEDGGGSITVDGAVTVSGSVTADTELPAAAALADNTANPTVPAVGSFLMGFDGTNWDRVRADGGSLFIQDGGNSITVDNGGTFAVQAAQSGTWNIGTVTSITNSVTVDSELPAAAALADDTSNPTAPAVGSFPHVWDPGDGNWDRLRGVNATLNAAAADSGILAAGIIAQLDDTSPTTITENQFGNLRMSGERALRVAGGIAHDGANSTSNYPIVNGGEAIAIGANPTAVAAADVSKAYMNRHGIPFVLGGHMNVVSVEAEYTSAQTNAAVITISTGSKIVVTQIVVDADNANTVDVGFRVGFGTASTPTTTGVISTHPGLAAGSGLVLGDGSGIVGMGADNEDLRITSEVPTTGAIRVLVKYFTIES